MDRSEEIRGLGLCFGVGGLELGLRIALPAYRTVALSEGEAYALAAVIARIDEGSLDECFAQPDLRELDARSFRGAVEVVTAGFPCQPHSVAGKRLGTADERWIWPDIARIIGECRAPCVFLENVPGLLRDAGSDPDGRDLDEPADDVVGGFGEVLRSLAQLGLHAEWCCVRAAAVGAAHQRNRVFILAYRDGDRRWSELAAGVSRLWGSGPEGSGAKLANAVREGPPPIDARESDAQSRSDFTRSSDGVLGGFAPGPADPVWHDVLVRSFWLRPALARAEIESAFRGVADGLAALLAHHRTDCLRATGNGCVPLQAAAAFVELVRRAMK